MHLLKHQDLPPSYALYQNSDYGFSIEYPRGWYHEDQTAESGTFTLTDTSGYTCTFHSTFTLQLTQSGNALSGTLIRSSTIL
jgi:hypothetical protein